MRTAHTALPFALIDAYWQQVTDDLLARGTYTAAQVRGGADAYRQAMDAARVGDVLYHDDPGRTAQAIIDGGYIR
ncbi:MAG: hypothetical protein U0871_20155 [Gemmataceae bacterium]